MSEVDIHELANKGADSALIAALHEHPNLINKLDFNHYTLLQRAVRANHYSTCRLLLEKNSKPNIATRKGRTALHEACALDYMDIAKLLIKFGADPFLPDENHEQPFQACSTEERGQEILDEYVSVKYPLHGAAKRGNARDAKQELDRGAQINLKERVWNSLFVDLFACLIVMRHFLSHVGQLYGNTALMYASAGGNTECAQLLIEHGADLDLTNNNGRTALHEACYHSHENLAILLVHSGSDPRVRDSSGRVALDCIPASQEAFRSKLLENSDGNVFFAAKKGDLALIQKNIYNNCDVNAKNPSSGETSLMMAIESGNLDCVQLLVDNRAHINGVADAKGLSVLSHAVMSGNIDIVRLLLEHGGDLSQRDGNGSYPLSLACKAANNAMATLLIESGADPMTVDVNGFSMLMYAAQNDDWPLQDLLLQRGADVSLVAKGTSALHFACSGTHCEAVRIMTEKGADIDAINRDGYTPLMLAAKNSRADFIQILIEHRANANIQDRNYFCTALHYSCMIGAVNCVALLAKVSAVDIQNKENLTALLCAVRGNFSAKTTLDMVKALLARSASVHVADKMNNLPVVYAVHAGNVDVVSALLDRGADVNTLDGKGKSILCIAVESNFIDCVKILVQRRVKINERGLDGETHLHRAIRANNVDLVKLLIDNHADVNVMNAQGVPPIQYAFEEGNERCMGMLIEGGVQVNRPYDVSTCSFSPSSLTSPSNPTISTFFFIFFFLE